MTQKPQTSKDAADKPVKINRRKTRQTYSAEEKIRIILAGLRGEECTPVICKRESILQVVEGISRGWQAAVLGRHGSPSDVAANEVSAFRSLGVEGMCGRPAL